MNDIRDYEFNRAVEKVYRCGPRCVAEGLRAIGATTMHQSAIEARFIEFAECLDPEIVKAVGADQFPPRPIHMVPEGGA